MTAVDAGMHPEWTPERLERLWRLVEDDAAYLASLRRRPWRVPVPAVLTDGEVAAAVADLDAWRARVAAYRVEYGGPDGGR